MLDGETQNLLVKERFDQESSDWLTLYAQCDFVSRGFAERQRLTLSLVPSAWDRQGRKALDIGCGAGLASLELASRGFSVTGIDISEKMIALAREEMEKSAPLLSCQFEVGDFNTIDFSDHSFDVVVALGLLEYLPDQRSTIGRVHRILKPGGLAVVTVPNTLRISNLLDPIGTFLLYYFLVTLKAVLPDRIVQVLRSRFRRSRSFDGTTCARPEPQRNRYTPWSLDRLFRNVGFDKVTHVGHHYGPFTFIRKDLFSDHMSQRIDSFLYSISRRGVLRFLQKFGANYIASYRKREKA